jgi:hypothetical protein
MNCPLRFHCQQQKGKNRRTYFLPFFAWTHTAEGMEHHNAHTRVRPVEFRRKQKRPMRTGGSPQCRGPQTGHPFLISLLPSLPRT